MCPTIRVTTFLKRNSKMASDSCLFKFLRRYVDRSLPNAIATEKIWQIDQTNNENKSVYISPIKVKYKTLR